MSKSANAGELRTAVYFKVIARDYTEKGRPVENEVNLFGQAEDGKDIPVMCKWVNAHGTDVYAAMQLQLRDPATITTRYSPLLADEEKARQTMIVYRGASATPYEVISVDDVEDRHVWLEIKVQRRVPAR